MVLKPEGAARLQDIHFWAAFIFKEKAKPSLLRLPEKMVNVKNESSQDTHPVLTVVAPRELD